MMLPHSRVRNVGVQKISIPEIFYAKIIASKFATQMIYGM